MFCAVFYANLGNIRAREMHASLIFFFSRPKPRSVEAAILDFGNCVTFVKTLLYIHIYEEIMLSDRHND